ncbi:hypothetical protein ES332_D05G095900v1 [Gossypium tomentosum]|uniref:Uncharacterized protein n=1 Tax=Gossypium tomentosum TaxID=34277 RepID=A0A5D2KTP9_GOSTO|nr:hypothetical protein ES332_D05G095900v1 [Gossypium tomentosum]
MSAEKEQTNGEHRFSITQNLKKGDAMSTEANGTKKGAVESLSR